MFLLTMGRVAQVGSPPLWSGRASDTLVLHHVIPPGFPGWYFRSAWARRFLVQGALYRHRITKLDPGATGRLALVFLASLVLAHRARAGSPRRGS